MNTARVLQKVVLCCAACLPALPVWSVDPPADEVQRRERLGTERAAAQARYEAAVRECERAFAVTGCVERARAERRVTFDRITKEEAMLDDAQRRRRAEERRQRIAQKQQEAAARAAASAPDMRSRQPRQIAPPASAPRASHRAEPRSREAAAAEAAAAKQRAAQAQRRRERAAAHEEAVRQRNEKERAEGKPPAAPLPVPSASAAPTR
jgi:colicin import membrane protein